MTDPIMKGVMLASFMREALDHVTYADIDTVYGYDVSDVMRPKFKKDKLAENTPAEPQIKTEKKPAESKVFDPIGKLFVFSPDHDDENLAGKILLVAEQTKDQRAYIAYILNNIDPRIQNFGQYTLYQHNLSCNADGKMIPVSMSGPYNPTRKQTVITSLGQERGSLPANTYQTLGELLISNSDDAFEAARNGMLNPKQTIVCIGASLFNRAKITEFVRDPECAIMSANARNVFSKTSTVSTLYQTGMASGFEGQGEEDILSPNDRGPEPGLIH